MQEISLLQSAFRVSAQATVQHILWAIKTNGLERTLEELQKLDVDSSCPEDCRPDQHTWVCLLGMIGF